MINLQRVLLVLFILVLVAGGSLLGPKKKTGTVLSTSIVGANQPIPESSPSAHVLGVRTKTLGCVAQNALPDKDCTPGQVLQNITKNQICVSGYAKSVRNVPESVKKKVYEEYGIYKHTTGEYEVDHLISLELGGSNNISNLWPEAAYPAPGFHEKDKVENYLHTQVCDGSIPLRSAQEEIAND